jgi:hypothetical protein
VLLSVVVHGVLLFTFFQIRILGGVFFGDSLNRLPELEKLAKADEERIDRFIKETTQLDAPADPTKMGGSEISGLEFSIYSPVSPERGLPDLVSPPLPDTAPTGVDKLLLEAERSASRPLLPPSLNKPGNAGPKLNERPGIPMKELVPRIPLKELDTQRPVTSPDHPTYVPPASTYPSASIPRHELPGLPDAVVEKKVWPLDGDIETDLVIYRDPASGEDFFRLNLRVREDSKLDVFSKDTLYLVDSSSSVKDSELQKIFNAVFEDISSMPANDRFNVVKFHLREESLFLGFNPFRRTDSDYIREFLTRPERSVLTNLSNTIRRSIEKFPGESGRPLNVVLFSDGKVSAGETGAASVSSRFNNALRDNHSLFAMNIGDPVDYYMLEMMSYTGKGQFRHCPDEARATEEIRAFLNRFSRPVLMNCEAQYLAPAVSDVYPLHLSNLYRDNLLSIYGKCKPGQEFALRIKGLGVKGPSDILIRLGIPEPDPNASEIVKEWARGRIYQLTDEYFNRGGGEDALSKIRTLSVRYGIGTPFDISR